MVLGKLDAYMEKMKLGPNLSSCTKSNVCILTKDFEIKNDSFHSLEAYIDKGIPFLYSLWGFSSKAVILKGIISYLSCF